MWNLVEPELLRMEPVCGTSRNLVQGFGRLPQTTPEALLEEPQAFQAVGEKWKKWNVDKICEV